MGDQNFTPPTTPSTRPSSASGCSTISDPSMMSASAMPLGRHLAIDELNLVAASIREALEAEQAQLLAAIGEQIQLLEVEDVRRAESLDGGKKRGDPSTAELQAFLHKLQEFTMNPALRTLALVGPSEAKSGVPASSPEPQAVSGGASVRRLQALIMDRRRSAGSLGAVPETTLMQPTPSTAGNDLQSSPHKEEGKGKQAAPSFDPFF